MIIIGYPGVGKSTLAQKRETVGRAYGIRGVIDLESSLFNVICTRDYSGAPSPKFSGWVEAYCNVAKELSRQGYLVFVSSHSDVQKCLREHDQYVGVVYPSITLKKEWLQKLRDRYMEDYIPEVKNKNFAAYNRACEHYEEDIEALKNNGFNLIEITSIDYDLDLMIFGDNKEAES